MLLRGEATRLLCRTGCGGEKIEVPAGGRAILGVRCGGASRWQRSLSIARWFDAQQCLLDALVVGLTVGVHRPQSVRSLEQEG